MRPEDTLPGSPIDRSMKALIRKVPPAFCRLAGIAADADSVRPEDVTVNLPEHRADPVLVFGAKDGFGAVSWGSLLRSSYCVKIILTRRR